MVRIILVTALLLTGCSTAIQGTPVAEPAPIVSMTDQVATHVKQSLQEKFDTDPLLKPLKLTVVRVTAINTSGNSYQGMATIRTFAGTAKDVSLQITADQENIMWDAGKGAFAWTFDDGYPDGATIPDFDGWATVVTKSGKTRCQIAVDVVECETRFDPPKYVGMDLVTGARFTADGALSWVGGSLDGDFNKLNYGTYKAIGWTIHASVDGTEFISPKGESMFINTSGATTG